MSNLVGRLRDKHSDLRGDNYWRTIYNERYEAADEIERLQADLVAADNTARINLQGCKDCMIEIERLRAALKTLEELGRHGMKPDYTEWLTFHDKVAQIAAAALNQQIAAKPIRVQCKCGWMGNQNDLVSIPGGKSCPECDAIFHPFPNHEKA